LIIAEPAGIVRDGIGLGELFVVFDDVCGLAREIGKEILQLFEARAKEKRPEKGIRGAGWNDTGNVRNCEALPAAGPFRGSHVHGVTFSVGSAMSFGLHRLF
jgi:hypothetical protein